MRPFIWAFVKYSLWVKVIQCQGCEKDLDLFPGFLLAKNTRHPKNVFVCPECGELTETEDRSDPGNCSSCHAKLALDGPARRNRCRCPFCDTENLFPDVKAGPPRHRLFAIEYHCPRCKKGHAGRFFKKPDDWDLESLEDAENRWNALQPVFVPDDMIPGGDETDRLHRWGYGRYREMFNTRQLLGLETSARLISGISDERVRNALATNLSDLLRYQNMLCRYDTMALKSLDFCYVWLRKLLGGFSPAFECLSTRNPQELTGNENMGRGLPHFTEGLSAVFSRMATALKPGSPLAFNYHHNDITAYFPVAVALLDSGLTCSASLPCPAEMSASIHINKTGSSIIDTVFVCRSTGTVPRRWLPDTASGVSELVHSDLKKLEAANVKPTSGDARCIAYGHLIRLAVWSLRNVWDKKADTDVRLKKIGRWLLQFGGWPEVEKSLRLSHPEDKLASRPMIREPTDAFGGEDDEVPFTQSELAHRGFVGITYFMDSPFELFRGKSRAFF